MRRRPETIRDANPRRSGASASPGLRASLVWISIVVIFLIFGCSSSAHTQTLTFGGFQGEISYTNINTGPSSAAANQVSVAVGHFQHSSASSSVLDLAVADAANSTVEIWFGNGDGTFQRPSGSQIYSLPPLTSIYPNAPPSSVEPTSISVTGNTQIAAADLTSDTGASGYDDVVLANFQGPGTITVLKNNRDGSGTFTASLLPAEVPEGTNDISYVTTGGGSVSLAIGDFNGDGVPDLVVGNSNTNYGGSIDVVLNNCSGAGAYNFCAPVSYNAGLQIVGVAAAPLRKSNTTYQDIVATDGANVYVLLNDEKTGTFPCAASSTCQTTLMSSYNNAISGLIAEDVNDDGYPDVVVEDQYGDPAVMLNNGSGGLGTPSTPLPVNFAAAAGVFNSANPDYPGLVLLANGGITYLPNTTSTPGGSVSFGTPAVIGPFTSKFDIGAALATGGFNGDGNLDVVAVTGSELHVALGNGNGTFQTTPSYLESLADPSETTKNASTSIAAIAVGDLHGTTNGAMDTVSADVGSANTEYPNAVTSLIVRLANANGTLQAGTVIFQEPVTTAQFNSIVLGNYGGAGFQPGGDGAMDIAAVTTTGEIYIFQNKNGNGSFTEAADSPVVTGFSSLTGAVAGDFAGNGSPTDIAAIGPVANADNYSGVPQSGSVIVILGSGNGSFVQNGDGGYGTQYQGTENSSASSLTTFVNPAQLAVGSLGSSGYPDIVVADSGQTYPTQAGGGVWVLRNQGSGTFSTDPLQVSATSAQCCGSLTAGPSMIALGHLFGTPYFDIVAATTPGSDQFLEVLENNGSYTFPIASTATTIYPFGGELAVADVNHDNAPDVLVFNGDTVQALLNTTNEPSVMASSGILLPWDPSWSTGPSPSLTFTGAQPPLFAVGYSASNPAAPNAVAGDAQPAVDVLLNGANGSGTQTLDISPATLPAGIVGQAYSQTLTATGGSGTGYTWDVFSGTALSAAGLSLSSGGVITGTPTTAEKAASVSIQVTDSQGNLGSVAYSLTVYPALSISPASLPTGAAGVAYSETLRATGGSGTGYTWSVTTGSAGLAALGLHLSAAGIISGIPVAGQASFTVKVADSVGNSTTTMYQLIVTAFVNIPTKTLLSSSTVASSAGHPIVLRATVTTSVPGTPTGSVMFYDGATVLGTETLTNGVAVYSTSALHNGANAIKAVYTPTPGTHEFLTSTSATLDITIGGFGPGFSSNGNANPGPVKAPRSPSP